MSGLKFVSQIYDKNVKIRETMFDFKREKHLQNLSEHAKDFYSKIY